MLLAGLAFSGALQAAAPFELTEAGWDRARWGMSSAELQRAYGDRARSFAHPFQYQDAFAEVALPGVELVGVRFTAFFQMDQATRRLRQVLVERRRHYATIALFHDLESELTARHGAPCRRMDAAGENYDKSIAVLERAWVLPAGAIHLSFINFRDDIPKRLSLRYHARGRPDLMAARPPPAGLEPAARTVDHCPRS